MISFLVSGPVPPSGSDVIAGADAATSTPAARPHRCAFAPWGAPVAVTVVELTGELDLANATLLHCTLTTAIDRHPRVCCDLSKVTFFGATAANTVFAASRHAARTGRRLTVGGARGITRSIFDITGLDRVLGLHD